jgi:hypothetical protein
MSRDDPSTLEASIRKKVTSPSLASSVESPRRVSPPFFPTSTRSLPLTMDTSSSTLDFSDLFNFPDSSSSALDDPPLSAGPFDAAFPASTGEQPSDDWDAYFVGTALDGACGGGGWDYGTLGGQHAGGGVELMDIGESELPEKPGSGQEKGKGP